MCDFTSHGHGDQVRWFVAIPLFVVMLVSDAQSLGDVCRSVDFKIEDGWSSHQCENTGAVTGHDRVSVDAEADSIHPSW